MISGEDGDGRRKSYGNLSGGVLCSSLVNLLISGEAKVD